MKTRQYAAALITLVLIGQTSARAQKLDTIGVTVLRAVTTNLNGAKVRVAQVEAGYGAVDNWEVNPGSVGQPTNLFTYTSSSGSATGFPNAVGAESGHANGVAGYFYGMSSGVATNVALVDNYEASYFAQQSGFLGTYSVKLPASNINDPVVNQSFIFCNADYSHYPVGWEQTIDSQYDNYAAQYNTLFVSGAGNGGPTNQSRIYPAATCYNGLGVAAFGGSSCTGPTLDNGRAKPYITAPGSETSWSTPLVAGAAAVLMQAGLRGDGGGATNSAADIRTVKALLLNGAVKPADWTNNPPSPLDPRYGAGVLNVFNSYEQLAGGEHDFIDSTTVSTGGAHPPAGATATVGVLSGWDFDTNTSGSIPRPFDAINHYYFNVTNADSNATFTATATLVWERHQNQTGINNLALFLYNAANSNLVAASTSVVDNVQQIFVPRLRQGRYDLQVWKAGGIGIVSAAEPYALAWAFTSARLDASKSGSHLNLSWPVYPDGFHLEKTAKLATPSWKTNSIPAPVFTNGQNVVVLGATNAAQFFRLRAP
ncbi:MAG TPA: S8 family serine peptidase [Verrucomicrobiae bacterium]|nr:S8 family serine peptidase [Verrucomicrobiae bacterium]